MGRALRGGRPQRGAHPRRFGMRQVARHPRLGAHRAQTARTGRSRDLRDRIRGALSRRCAHDLHHRFERQDDHHVARLPDSARRGLQRRPGRQHRRELRLFGRNRPVRLACAGTQLVPTGRHVQVPGRHRCADQHHARPPRPLRPLVREVCRGEDAHCAEPACRRLLHLFGRRRNDLVAAAVVSAAAAAAALRRTGCRRRQRRRRLPEPRRPLHGRRGRPFGRDRHAPDAYRRAAQRLQRHGCRTGRARGRRRARPYRRSSTVSNPCAKRTVCCGSTIRRRPTSIRCGMRSKA